MQKSLYDYLITKQILSLDTETTSTSAIDAELVGLSFAVKEKEAFYVAIPANREEALKFVNIFKPLYENPEILKVGQNIKYDYEVLDELRSRDTGKDVRYDDRPLSSSSRSFITTWIISPRYSSNTRRFT